MIAPATGPVITSSDCSRTFLLHCLDHQFCCSSLRLLHCLDRFQLHCRQQQFLRVTPHSCFMAAAVVFCIILTIDVCTAGSSSFSGSRSTYTHSGSGSDSRTTSASSYTTATDSRPVSAKLPAIATAQPKGKGLPPVAVKSVVKQATVVKSSVVVKKSDPRRPDTASSYSSESGSDSSYSSSSGSESSYSR